MEYPSINDFYLLFKAIYDREDKFIDYELVYVSDNFQRSTGINPELILGEKISYIVVENLNKLGLKDLYLKILPNKNVKFVTYDEGSERRYMVSTFTKDDESMIVFYNDITDIYSEEYELEKGIGNIYYLENIKKLRYKDKLTGLYNKSYFEAELLRLNTKRQLPISLIVADINGLNIIGETFGDNESDDILKKTAKILKQSFRAEDIISRVGVDRFIILLPKTKESTSLNIVERINNNCKQDLSDFIDINISFGVAAKVSEDQDIQLILEKAEKNIYYNKLKDSEETKKYMIKFLRSKIEKITAETKEHNKRLKELCFLMADDMELSIKEKNHLSLLCEFHDIGNMCIPKDILLKEGLLDKEEWETVKKHSEIGYNLAGELREISSIDELILSHHERWDGKGYPGLLKNNEIPVLVRIFSVADAYDAMVNQRTYKSMLTNEEALLEIKRNSGSQFDPSIAEKFISIMINKEKVI